MNDEYTTFLQSKRRVDVDCGFDVNESDLNPMLFPFQKYLVRWALKRGRAALFTDTGTGKTVIQLSWASMVHQHTGHDILILSPLAVSKQTRREGLKLGLDVTVCRSQADVKPGLNIANYEMLGKFNPAAFGGIVLDESGILKGLYGKFRAAVTEFCREIPYRLACTATPAPNDTMEIVNHAEFLGVMTAKEVFALFFTQDFTATSHKWRLKKHAVNDFWRWLASWARAMRMPSDLGFDDNGFILPPLKIHTITVDSDPMASGMLFPIEARGIQEQRAVRRASLVSRVVEAARLANSSDEQWLLWCDLNDESKAAKDSILGAVEVKGADTAEHKEKSLLAFADGEIHCLVSKSSICGHGMNFQSCHNVIFLGLSNSFESFYQAIRRCWRFGQKSPVNVYLIVSDTDSAVQENIRRKEAQANELFAQLLANMREHQMPTKTEKIETIETVETHDGWTMYLGDSVDTVKRIENESVGLIVFSPPFPSMYVYMDSTRDMGNVASFQEMIHHFSFLIPELCRVLMPGRTCAIHLTQGIAFKHTDGYCGLKDFRGAVIAAMETAKFIYYGEVAIDKDPQLKALRTKDHGLLFKTLAADAAKSRMAMADYVLQFRKPGDNPQPIRAGMADHLKDRNTKGWITNKEWVEYAAPVWYRKTENYPGGISESDVLNVSCAREADDERHLCPLQLGVIERVVKLWSNPGDLVYSPFAGIGSEGYMALKLGRRFVGGELKRSYFETACKNLREAEKLNEQQSLDFSCGAV
ncbi:MAG: DNA methyltransferase [Patescibacteria group bacterium]